MNLNGFWKFRLSVIPVHTTSFARLKRTGSTYTVYIQVKLQLLLRGAKKDGLVPQQKVNMKKKRKEATFCYLFLLTLLLVYLYVFHSSITTTISSNEEFKSNLWWQSSPLWVEDQRPQVNPHKFGYLINQPELCQSDTEMTLLGGCPKSWSKGISLFSVLEVMIN